MGYFEFLYGSGIIFLHLNIPQKLHCQHLFKKPEEAERLIVFILTNSIQYPRTPKSNIYHSNKWVQPPFFHSYTNPVFGHILINYFEKTHVLSGTVELIWLLLLNIISFNLAPVPNKFLLGSQDSEEAISSTLLSF